MTMVADNNKAKRAEAGPLRMKQAQPLEAEVCALSIKLADRVAKRVQSMHMTDLPLPLDYLVKIAQHEGKAGIFLIKNGASTPYVVNESNPIVEVCRQFSADVADGLLKKIEEAYRKRQAEFAAAKELLTKELASGVQAFVSTSSEEPEFNRFQIIGENGS